VRRRLAAWAGLALAGFALAGCWGSATPPPPRTGWVPGTLRIAQHSDFRSLDPAVGNDTALVPVIRMLFQPLLDYDDGQRLVPLVAEDVPKPSDDGKKYTFHLKKGVRFSNGREVTADDFVYAWTRVLDPRTKSPGASYLLNRIVGADDFAGGKADTVAGLHAPDRFTLEVDLVKPDQTFPYVTAMTFFSPVPREEVEKYPEGDRNDEFAVHPVGNGPFVLAEWKRGMRMRLERDPHYWGTPPALGAIDVKFNLDDLTRQMMFERGELDLTDVVPPPDYVRLRNDPRWQPYIERLVFNGVYFVNLNCEMPPFDGPNGKLVRKAFCYAINKERIVKVTYDRYVPAVGVVPPGMPGWHTYVQGYSYDPEKAKKLLAEAGYSHEPLQLWYSNESTNYDRFAQVVKQDLAEVGVEVELNPVNYDVFLPKAGKRHEVALSLSGWFQDYPDASDFLGVLFSSGSITDVECNNMSFYHTEKADALMDAGDREADPVKRLDLYAQAEEVVMDDAPVVPLVNGVEVWMRQPWLKGFKIHPVWLVRYEKLSVSPP
jgi:ABC-type transport system substrate-binding protein